VPVDVKKTSRNDQGDESVTAFTFGPFVLDVDDRRLTRDGEPVVLAGKAFDALELLADAGGRLVPRDRFYASLWPDTVVEERTLTVHISTLRRTLNGGGPVDYIETVPRAGYRLTVPVQRLDPPAASGFERPAAGSPPRRRWLRALAAAAAVVLLVAGLSLHMNEPSPGASASAPVTLAVLPFAMLGLPEADRYLGIGIADAIITQLSGVPRLAVRPTSAVGGIGDGADSAMEGRRLQVANVLEGAIQRDGDRLLVTVRLVDPLSATARWGERFEEPVSDAFALQDAIARKVAGVLLPRIAEEEVAALHTYRPRSDEAYRLHLQARVNLSRYERDPAFKAVEQFQQAIALDPGYALAHAGLASAYAQLTSTLVTRALSVPDGLRLARAAADQALALDPRLGEAHAVLAELRFVYDWDWRGAEEAFHSAAAVAPNAAETQAAFGWFLAAMGRHDEALERLETARRLDPSRRDTLEMLGFVQWMAGDAELGLATLAEATALDPDARRPYFRRMLILDQLGRAEEAMAERAQWLTRFDEAQWAVEIVEAHRSDGYAAALAPWIRMLDRLDQPYEVAMQWMALGEPERALDALARCFDERCSSAPFLRQHPTFRPLHGDPRFETLALRLGLPPTAVPKPS